MPKTSFHYGWASSLRLELRSWLRQPWRHSLPLLLCLAALLLSFWTSALRSAHGSQTLPGITDHVGFALGVATTQSRFLPMPGDAAQELISKQLDTDPILFATPIDFDLEFAGAALGKRTVELCLPGYFDALGLTPLRGAWPRRSSASPDSHAQTDGAVPLSAAISESLWKTTLGRDERIVGRQLLINGAPVVVTAVVAAPFAGITTATDVWVAGETFAPILLEGPSGSDDQSTAAGAVTLDVAAVMLASESAPSPVGAQMTALQSHLRTSGTLAEDERLVALPAVGRYPEQRLRHHREWTTAMIFAILVAMFALALLAVDRIRCELERRPATRTVAALGAPPAALIGSRLTVFALALAIPILLAWLVSRLSPSVFATPGLALPPGLGVLYGGGAILALAAVASLLLGDLFGGVLGRVHRHGRRVFGGLLIAVNLSGLLVMTITLALVNEYRQHDAHHLGFDLDGLWTTAITPEPGSRQFAYLNPSSTQGMLDAIDRSLHSVGAEAYALSTSAPLQPARSFGRHGIGWQVDGARQVQGVVPVTSSDNLFAFLGISLVAGRPRIRGDDDGAVVVNMSLARTIAASPGSAVGRSFRAKMPGKDGWRTFSVVGVAPDLAYDAGTSPSTPRFFRGLSGSRDADFKLLLRPGPKTVSILAALRTLPGQFYPGRCFCDGRYYTDLQSEALSDLRARTSVATLVALFQALIATIATLLLWQAFLRSRLPELALRVAVGAHPRQLIAEAIATSGRLIVVALALAAPVLWFIAHRSGIALVPTPASWITSFAVATALQFGTLGACAAFALHRTLANDANGLLRDNL